MCIAILAPKGQTVPNEVLVRAFNGNRDGAGFAYIKKGEIVVDKGYMELPVFCNKYKQLIASKVHEDSPMLIHCRIATIGKVCAENCHPFRIREGAMIHNGSLWWDSYSSRASAKSDTRLFAERLHNALKYDDMIVDKAGLEKAIGFDKMAFLFKTGKYIILNEDRGTWHGGVWYSHAGPISTPRESWLDHDLG